MALVLLVVLAAIVWLALGLFALSTVNKALRKYRNVKDSQYPPEWQAFIRGDFNKWDEKNIKVGCFLRLPFKFLGMLFLFGNLIVMVYLKKRIPSIGARHEALIVLYGFYFLPFVFKYDQRFQRQKISTPLVITNHVCWFDIVYLAQICYPLSFVSKSEVESVPLIGAVGNYLQCIWINRKDQTARERILQTINERIQIYKKQPQVVNPLLIFPEGTTSNGQSIMRFKIGAFNDLARITMFGLQYQCEGFGMGMEEVNPIEHVVISLCLSPKLTVHRAVMQPLPDETSKQYMNRCQQELARLTGYKIYDTGYTEKCQFKEMRSGKKKN